MEDITLYDLRDVATGITTPAPVVCGTCARPRRVFVNRMGATRCLECDAIAVRTELATLVMMQREQERATGAGLRAPAERAEGTCTAACVAGR